MTSAIMGKRLLGLVAVLLLLAWSFYLAALSHPHTVPFYRDSSAFAYVGQTILEEGRPYTDAWDHKPPLLYFIYALIIGTPGVDLRLSIWGSGTLASLFSVLIFFLVMQKIWGNFNAAVTSILFSSAVLAPELFGDGGYSESFALIFQVLIVLLGCKYFDDRKSRWLLLSGGATGIILLINPRSVSIGVSLLFAASLGFLLNRRMHQAARSALVFSVGLLVPIAAILVHAYVQGWLIDMYNAVVVYNRLYLSDAAGGLRLLGRGVTWILRTEPFLALVVSASFTLLLLSFSGGDNSPESSDVWRRHMTGWVWIAVIMDAVLLFSSRWFYTHYFIAAVPSLALATSFFLGRQQADLRKMESGHWLLAAFVAYVLLLSTSQLVVTGLDQARMRLLYSSTSGNCVEDELVPYIKANTVPSVSDSVKATHGHFW